MKSLRINQVGKTTLVRRLGFFGAIAVCLFLNAPARGGQSVSLAWNASASVGVSGYKVYRGVTNGAYTSSYDVGTNLAVTLTGLAEGATNFFMVAAYNTAGMQGAPSVQISYIVPGCVLLCPAAKPGSSPGITFPVAVGHTYVVQASTNLTSWTTVYTTNAATSNIWVNYQDPQNSQYAQRFYRLILQ